MTYASNLSWSERFLPELKAIFANEMIVPAPTLKDQREATDMMLITVRPGSTLGCRVRRPDAFAVDRYRGQITFRLSTRHGGRSEFAKIVDDGFCDWYLYAFGDSTSGRIFAYRFVDLAAFRQAWRDGVVRYEDKDNGPDDTMFRAVVVSSLPSGVVARSWKMRGVGIVPGGVRLPANHQPPAQIRFPWMAA